MTNMYQDSIFQWNVFKGCHFDCVYCKKSYQLQAKRQKHRCQDCYDYKPHVHWERLEDDWIRKNVANKKTEGDQFIWCCSSGDISFLKKSRMQLILERISWMPSLTFFIQTKNPEYYNGLIFPENLILGITLETNYDTKKISKAPNPSERVEAFSKIPHPRKCITIEPILHFYFFDFMTMLIKINPERIYIGYDTKKCYLNEPSLDQTLLLIDELKLNLPHSKIKEKLIRPAWDEK